MAVPLRDDAHPTIIPWVTWGLMLVCVIVYLFLQPRPMQTGSGHTIEQRTNSYFEVEHFVDRWGMVPCEITHDRSIRDGAACNGYPVDDPEAYPPKHVLLTLLTSIFLHGNLTHIAGNLLFLWVFGRAVEQRVGHPGFLLLYLAGGVVASLGLVAVRPESMDPLVGASGAIAAVMGVYLVFQPRRRVLSFVFSTGVQVVYLPVWAMLGLFFVTQFFTPGSSRVAWQAHVAGMVFGALVGLVLLRVHRVRGEEPPGLLTGGRVQPATAGAGTAPTASAWPMTPPTTPPALPEPVPGWPPPPGGSAF